MKKVVAILMLLGTLLLCFTSCAHEHEWGEWVIERQAGYSSSGRKCRYCSQCNESEEEYVSAYGDSGVENLLKGRWRETGASADDFLIDISFSGSRFTAKVYMLGSEMTSFGRSGSLEITEERITLKNDDGSVFSYFTYTIEDDEIALVDYEKAVWEKYEN